jgi:hypothetical protein
MPIISTSDLCLTLNVIFVCFFVNFTLTMSDLLSLTHPMIWTG